MGDSRDLEDQQFIAAYEYAAGEARAWEEVAEHRFEVAAGICRDRGMSIRETASELDVKKSTLARVLAKPRSFTLLSARARELEDQALIRVGLGKFASPQAQFAAGLIDEYQRDAMVDEDRRRGMSIPDQIREVVARYPGIANVDLPRMIVMAVLRGTTPDLRHHAGDAECAVDGAGRWWPTKLARDLAPGDRVVRFEGDFERGGLYEWVSVESVTQDDAVPLDERLTVRLILADGTVQNRDERWDQRYPVKPSESGV